MFQATQPLTLRAIASLWHLKIHPPLPLTPRESTLLLNLLTTSFRRQLDREHGTGGSEDGATAVNTPASFLSPKLAHGKHRQHSQSRSDVRTLTDHHLHSILTNPLLNDVEKKPESRGQQRRDPMDIFDEAYAKGFMKIEYAAACLKAKKQKILHSSALSVRDAMKSSGAGFKTLNWMLLNGVASDGLFLEDLGFSEIFVDFLVAEGLQSVIWAWLETLFLKIPQAKTKTFTKGPTNVAANLVYFLVKAQASESGSLDIATDSLGKAEKMLTNLRLKCRPVLRRAGEWIYWKIVNNHTSYPASASDTFNFYLSIVPRIFPFSSEIALSTLWLYHPTEPDAKPALKYLAKAKKIASTASDPAVQHAVIGAGHLDTTRTFYLGLNTARFLLENDHHAKAHWVMSFLEETYGKHLGLSAKTMFSLQDQEQAESLSLELLSSFKMA